MGIEEVKANILQERRLIDNMLLLVGEINNISAAEERDFFVKAVKALEDQLRIINNSIPEVLQHAVAEPEEKPLEHVATLQIPQGFVTISKKEKKKFIEELQISEEALKKVKKRKKNIKLKEDNPLFKKPSAYVAVSSRLFSKQAFGLADRGFKDLNSGLRRANMPYLLSTYISMMLFTGLLVFVISIVLAIFLSFFNMSLVIGIPYPVIEPLTSEGLTMRLIQNILLAFFAPIIAVVLFYFYPSSQAKSIGEKIENELPFAIIHMSSIAGSGVEPSKIFQILALSTEYPAISKEMRKLVNQVNLYGYDLVNALRTTAKATSSPKLRDLLNGLSTNISEGGDIKTYLEKKSGDTLLDYKLERRKYSSIAETSMDIYIGILIAAPLILMVMLILMSLTGIGTAFDQNTLTLLITGGISVLNIGFIFFLNFRQPV